MLSKSLAVTLLALVGAPIALAGTPIVLAPFGSANRSPNSQLAFDAHGNIYGTTGFSGSGLGTVYELPDGSNQIVTRGTFGNVQGAGYPSTSGVTTDADGNLYGSSQEGGSASAGGVFEIPTGSNTISFIASFTSGYSVGNPAYPSSLYRDASGNLFGTVKDSPGGSPPGSPFEIPAGSNSINFLVGNCGTGEAPSNANHFIADPAGNLYATTWYLGGPSDAGTIFKLTPGARPTVTTLANFDYDANGFFSSNLTRDAAGDLFCTTAGAGGAGFGAICELPAGGSTIQTLVSLPARSTDVVSDAEGDLFGTMSTGSGIVYEVPAGSSNLTTIATLGGSFGSNPYDVAFGPDGNLYGATQAGALPRS